MAHINIFVLLEGVGLGRKQANFEAKTVIYLKGLQYEVWLTMHVISFSLWVIFFM